MWEGCCPLGHSVHKISSIPHYEMDDSGRLFLPTSDEAVVSRGKFEMIFLSITIVAENGDAEVLLKRELNANLTFYQVSDSPAVVKASYIVPFQICIVEAAYTLVDHEESLGTNVSTQSWYYEVR